MVLTPSLDEKFKYLVDNYNKYFINKDDPDAKGSFIPASTVKMNSSGKFADVTIFDTSIVQLSKYLVYLTLRMENLKANNDENFQQYEGWLIDTLRAIRRLSRSAYEIYCGVDPTMKLEPGFLLKDDVGKDLKDMFFTNRIVSNYSSNVEKVDEDPNRSEFVGLMQYRVLLCPLTYLYMKYPQYREYTKVVLDILYFIVGNHCSVYNPYLSKILYNSQKTVKEDVEPEIGETMNMAKRHLRDKGFRMNIPVKLNSSNIFYSAGMIYTLKRLTGLTHVNPVSAFLRKILFKMSAFYIKSTSFPNFTPILSAGFSSHVTIYGGYDGFREYVINRLNDNVGNRKIVFYAALLVLENSDKTLNLINKNRLTNFIANYRGFSTNSDKPQSSDIEALTLMEIYRRMEDSEKTKGIQ